MAVGATAQSQNCNSPVWQWRGQNLTLAQQLALRTREAVCGVVRWEATLCLLVKREMAACDSSAG